MDKSQFFAECQQFANAHLPFELRQHLITEKYPSVNRWSTDGLPLDAFYAAWETGGYSGGSCYGGTASRYSSNSPEAELGGLDEFLEKHAPAVTLLVFRKLERRVKRDSFTEGGYYGNSTEHAYKWLTFEDAWTTLVEAGLVSER